MTNTVGFRPCVLRRKDGLDTQWVGKPCLRDGINEEAD
jgi:hypothetical protein